MLILKNSDQVYQIQWFVQEEKSKVSENFTRSGIYHEHCVGYVNEQYEKKREKMKCIIAMENYEKSQMQIQCIRSRRQNLIVIALYCPPRHNRKIEN